MMNQHSQHRNKCQKCFKNIGKFILDCYCFLCLQCFNRIRNQNTNKCIICFKPTSGKFIDARDQAGLSKVSYLFGNLNDALSKCMDINRFQNDVDMRYIYFLERELAKYKSLVTTIVSQNPRLKEYVGSFLNRKATPHKVKSASESMQNYGQFERQPDRENRSNRPSNYSSSNQPRSVSAPSVQSIEAYHERIVDAHPVNQEKNRHYSAKVGIKVPNLNYSTALRSSRRPNRKDLQQDEGYYNRR